jgi:selenide, water dikinase
LSQQALAQVLRRLPQYPDANVLVGSATADDAGIYRLDRDRALVQTVDFFTPVVDDPFSYGQIAAANGLSDIYAMGGRPLTAMALMGVPTDKLSPGIIREILRGGAAKVKEARCSMIGGHTIRNPEPIYGLSVTGMIHPKRLMTNAGAKPGDLLVLTKPLGIGIVTTGIKRGICSERTANAAIRLMKQLNTAGTELAENSLARAAVDITGFGFLGHLGSMCRASGVGVELDAGQVPALDREVFSMIEKKCIPGGSRDNLEYAEQFVEWERVPETVRILLADAQTSGGLLLAIKPRDLEAVRKILKKHRTPAAAVIGRVVRSKPKIRVVGGSSD